MNAPDTYMDKIAIGPGLPDHLVDLDAGPEENLKQLAKAKKMEIADLVACILDRPRHSDLIARVRASGARIMLISDGDVSGVISTASAPTAASISIWAPAARPKACWPPLRLRCIGGQMQGRLIFRNDDEKGRARRLGITDLNRKYGLMDLARGNVMFAATGVTDGTMLKGVRRSASMASTHSIIMRSKSGTVRLVEAQHNWNIKPSLV